MVYSEQVDGVFCIACAIFCANPLMGKFVTEPFRVWNKKSEKVKEMNAVCTIKMPWSKLIT